MSSLLRHWRIVDVDDASGLELEIDGPAHLALDAGGRGELCFFLLEASVDAREVEGRLNVKPQVALLRQVKSEHVRLPSSYRKPAACTR